MKIVHCCFGMEHYLDTWGYQQNVLPMYHAKMGHETTVLASNDTFPTMAGGKLVEEIKSKGDNYFNGLVFVRRSSSYFPKLLHFQKAKSQSIPQRHLAYWGISPKNAMNSAKNSVSFGKYSVSFENFSVSFGQNSRRNFQ